MTYRFKVRSTTTGAYRFVANAPILYRSTTPGDYVWKTSVTRLLDASSVFHVAYFKPILADAFGIVDKRTSSLSRVLNASTEMHIAADSWLPNTVGYPTLKRYLELEAEDGFHLQHFSNTMVITTSCDCGPATLALGRA